MTGRPIVCTLAALLAFTAAMAHAEPVDDQRTLFPVDAPACFAKFFDAAHLQAHPSQTVTALRLVRGYPQMRIADEAGPADSAPAKAPEQASHFMAQLVVTFRDRGKKGEPRRFAAAVSCGSEAGAAKIHCGIECDGGGFLVEREATGGLRMTIDGGNNLRIAGGCTNRRAYRGLGREPGDRSFGLAAMPLAACR